ncbi:MBL fold metallo-hydrolase [Paenarthrobacter sp. YAF11_1]|uniref:MBL fold metallo-hydrolase n=1 Tax=Paenarthrobacter sp. YAF11_1 TaxID=3233074 RepID=UPI003F9CA616
MSRPLETIVQQVHLPAGMAGPDKLSFDVRCFVLPVAEGIVLIDAGLAGSMVDIERGLDRVGAGWGDVSDVVLTHSHPDHVGGLEDVLSRTTGAAVWAGDGESDAVVPGGLMQRASEGQQIRGLRVIRTPGHTEGHISLLLEDKGLMFVGDTVGVMDGTMVRPPAPFTADPAEAERSLWKIAHMAPDRMVFSHGAELPDAVSRLLALLEEPSAAS